MSALRYLAQGTLLPLTVAVHAGVVARLNRLLTVDEAIVGNVLDNAREHAPGTPVDVSLGVTEGAIVIAVGTVVICGALYPRLRGPAEPARANAASRVSLPTPCMAV